MHATTPAPERGRDRRFAGILLPGALILLAVGTVAAVVVTGNGEPKAEAALPSGTVIVAALASTVSTRSSDVGDPVELETAEPVSVNGETVLPAGARIRGEVTRAEGGGRVAGAPALALQFTSIDAEGIQYRIETRSFLVSGRDHALESAAQIGGGAVAGGVVGGALGGEGGALTGAALGAALGTGVAIATDGDDLTLPAGVKLRIELAAPVTIAYQPAKG
jgi:hypothetical protein